MFSTELEIGRRIGVVLQPSDDVLPALIAACNERGVAQGYLSVFLGAFRTVSLIGTNSPIEDDDAPLKDAVHLTNVEGTGSGTIATSLKGPVPHLHVAVGTKGDGAAGYAGHLISATVQYVTEIIIEEVLSPRLVKRPDPRARGIECLVFEHTGMSRPASSHATGSAPAISAKRSSWRGIHSP